MLKTVAGTQITKIIVKDKNGNTLASDLEKIVCNGNTIYIKQCNLTIQLFYGFSNIDSWTECGTSYERYYPLPLKFKASWGITEKIKSVQFSFSGYSSDCFSNVSNNTTITTNGETKEISASRFWSDTDGGYIGFAPAALFFVTFFDDTTKTLFMRNAGSALHLQIKDGPTKNQYTNFSISTTV